MVAVLLVRWLRLADPDPQLTGPEASALSVVVFAGAITPSALADMEQVTRPSIARTVRQLEGKGLIVRQENPEDRRSVILAPTPAGLTLMAAGQRRRIRPLTEALAALPTDRRRDLEAALPVLETILRQSAGVEWRSSWPTS